ncbi:MAG: polysaccharide biosynthesis tyrosine autokinase, partial [Saprospiraceae bacterium]|nr:polysaccharide biosynthesis tyrosine autokinase [Saprospiraceae bacterium]
MNSQQNFAELIDEKPVDLKPLLWKYLLGPWYFYVIGLALAFTAAWLFLRYTPRVYQATTTLLVRADEKSGGGIQENFILEGMGMGGANKNIDNEIEILKSRSLMRQTVDSLKLQITYLAEGRIRSGEQYANSPVYVDSFQLIVDAGISFELTMTDSLHGTLTRSGQDDNLPFILDSATITPWGEFWFSRNPRAKPGSMEGRIIIQFQDPENVAAAYAGMVKIQRIGKWSSALSLTLTDNVAEKAADVLNALCDTYNRTSVQEKNQVSENTYRFITDRLNYLTAELSDVEGSYETFQKQNPITADIPGSVTDALETFRENDKALSQLELQQQFLASLEATLDGGRYSLLPANFLVDNADLTAQTTDYNNLIQERQRLLGTVSAEHYMVRNAEDKITAARAVMKETLRQTKNNLSRSNTVLAQKNRQLQGRLGSLPRVQRELVEITRQKNIKENLYLYLLQKREEAALSLAVAVPNARILDPARPNNTPVEPKPRLVYALALLFGLGLPLGFLVLRDRLNDSIETPDQIRNNATTPLLGLVGLSKKEGHVVVSKSSRSSVSEMFRLLRTNLQFLLTGEGHKVVLVTSAIAGEGKSFVALNLAMTLALSGKRTILIGLDLRKPKLSRYLSLEENLRGITNYLIGDAEEQDIIVRTKLHPSLDFIASGPVPPNPAELILQDRMGALIAHLSETYDYILIDSPPIGLVSDALLLARHAHATLFVVRQGISKKNTLPMIDDLASNQKLPSPAIVFNGVEANRGYGYGYGYG